MKNLIRSFALVTAMVFASVATAEEVPYQVKAQTCNEVMLVGQMVVNAMLSGAPKTDVVNAFRSNPNITRFVYIADAAYAAPPTMTVGEFLQRVRLDCHNRFYIIFPEYNPS